MTLFNSIITNPAFSIASLLIGFLLGHYLAIGRDKRNDFNKAAAIFREAFYPEIILLKHNVRVPDCRSYSDNPSEFLFAGYTLCHLKAFEVFRAYLSSKDKIGIDKAWKEYCKIHLNIFIFIWKKLIQVSNPLNAFI
jgi:hypothetical protein